MSVSAVSVRRARGIGAGAVVLGLVAGMLGAGPAATAAEAATEAPIMTLDGLSAAFAAATTAETDLVLGTDLTGTALNGTLTTPDGSTIVLDLGGYDLDLTGAGAGWGSIVLGAGSTLTITDTTGTTAGSGGTLTALGQSVSGSGSTPPGQVPGSRRRGRRW